MSQPKPYRIETETAYAAEGMLARLPERCERLARLTVATTLTDEELEIVRAEGHEAAPLPAEASYDEMNEAVRQIAGKLNDAAGRTRWTPRETQRLSGHVQQIIESLATGHYVSPPLSDDQPARIAGPDHGESDLLELLASYGLTPEDLLINDEA